MNIKFISPQVKSPTLIYGGDGGVDSTYVEADNMYVGKIVYNEGQIVYAQVYYQPHEIVTQQFLTLPYDFVIISAFLENVIWACK